MDVTGREADGVPSARNDEAAVQFDLPYVSPAAALTALQHAVSPRTYDPSERFTPLLGLTQFHEAFDGHRFRFRCAVGSVRPIAFDVDGEFLAYVRTCRRDLELRLRELRPFLLARIPP